MSSNVKIISWNANGISSHLDELLYYLKNEPNAQNVNSSLRCANCQQAHSAAYRGCPMYQKQKDIMEIKVTNKISYAEAAGKLKDREFILSQESAIPKSMINSEASGDRVYLKNPQNIGDRKSVV